jgi:hypothetical protein
MDPTAVADGQTDEDFWTKRPIGCLCSQGELADRMVRRVRNIAALVIPLQTAEISIVENDGDEHDAKSSSR